MQNLPENTTCPFCKEEVKADAIKCKHCGSFIEVIKPKHNGICPFCKEQINKDAIKCKHCSSDLTVNSKSGCGCGCQDNAAVKRNLGYTSSTPNPGNAVYPNQAAKMAYNPASSINIGGMGVKPPVCGIGVECYQTIWGSWICVAAICCEGPDGKTNCTTLPF